MKKTLHESIRSDIEAAILSGALSAGDRLPTEADLMAQYGCSRMTVNKAISALVAATLVERRKKAGSFVARPKMHSMVLDIPDLEAEVLQRRQRYAFRLLSRTVRAADADKEYEQQLSGGGALLALTGLHLADDRPLAFEERLVSLSAVPDIENQWFDDMSAGSWLLKYVPWTEAETRIAAVNAAPDLAAHLGQAVGTACLSVERRTWRGEAGVTWVRQHFVGSDYDLIAHFGPSRAG
jgi:GntR family transcriptional regulator, histidine utilization repressor